MELILVLSSAESPLIWREASDEVVMLLSIFLESNSFRKPSALPERKNWSATF